MSDTLEQAMLESELALALADETLITPVNEYLLIDPETRLIEVPESESLFGVYSENDVEVKHFACPRIVLNNIDLFEMYIFINYVSASGRYGQTLAKNIKTSEDGNYITFDWELNGNVFDKNTNGKIYFAVMAKKQMEDKKPVFATRKASGDCYETIEAGEVIQEQHADIILEMLTRIEALEKGGTGGSSFDCDMLIQMEYHLHGYALEENITTESFTVLKGTVSDVMSKWANKEAVKVCLLSRWYYEDDGWHYDLYEADRVEMYLDDEETYGYELGVTFKCGGNAVVVFFDTETNAVNYVNVVCREIVTTSPYDYRKGQVAISDGNGGVTWKDFPTGGSSSDWDMLIKTTNFTSDTTNYTVVKGNATDIFTRCKAGEQLKVGLWVEYDSDDPASCIVSAESVDATGELGGYSWLEIVFGYNDGEDENAWDIGFDADGITNNTIYRVKYTYLYEQRMLKHPTNEWGSPQFGKVGQVAVSDGNGGILWVDSGGSGSGSGATTEQIAQIEQNKKDIADIKREIGDVELLLSGL